MIRLAIVALLTFSACTHSIHHYQVSDYQEDQKKLNRAPVSKAGRTVAAEGQQFVVLGITGNTDYADEAYRQLLTECPKGEIVGIHSRHSTSHGFLSYTNKVHLQAFCLNN